MDDKIDNKKTISLRINTKLHKKLLQIALDRYGNTYKHVGDLINESIQDFIDKLEADTIKC